MMQENTQGSRGWWWRKFLSLLADGFNLIVIFAVGWFLIGYYTDYEYLSTGYQDWIYHAFRIQEIERYGISSWDHIWSSGINHWRAYQYIQHFLTLKISQFFEITITNAILWVSVIVFVGLRIILYLFLRKLKISSLVALFAVIASYVFSQQWVAIKDFSIHVGFIFLPLYVLLWIITVKEKRYIYLLSAFTGSLWSVHPVMGYSATGMLFILVLASKFRREVFGVISVFCISSLPFVVPYLFSGYSFSNPIFASNQFLKDTLLSEYFGLSLLYFGLLGISWFIFVVNPREVSQWAKLLLVYCSVYLIIIYIGQQGYYPSFINKLQISRAIPFVATVLPFCFAAFLEVALRGRRSRIFPTVLVIVMAISIVQSIDIASLYTGYPTNSLQNPAAMYFQDKEIPKGSVYFENVSEASYLAKPGLRYATSYNEHLQPHPYSTRLRSLMKTDISYTGVTDRQIELIDDYATVLGIEYLFLPKLSPLVNGLTHSEPNAQAPFEKIDEVTVSEGVYVVLHKTAPVHNAYAFDGERKKDILHFNDLDQPTLHATSYAPWDKEVSRIALLIRQGTFQPLPVQFIQPDGLQIELTKEVSQFNRSGIFVTQSYDKNWKIQGLESVVIEPTNLRFMTFLLPDAANSSIKLVNHWPSWHWPVQTLGIVMILLTGGWLIFRSSMRKVNPEKTSYEY